MSSYILARHQAGLGLRMALSTRQQRAKHIRQLTKWLDKQQQQQLRLVVNILERLSPAKIQIQICLKLQSSHGSSSAANEQHRKLAIDLGANLVLNCDQSDRCHDAGVYNATQPAQAGSLYRSYLVLGAG